jgi:hypothetical protein
VAYSKANNLSFIETSALDSTNVKKAFEKYRAVVLVSRSVSHAWWWVGGT